MITIEQCRAARGLLDWTQQDLARNAGLSKTAINNFEKGYSDIKAESLRAIRSAFESHDVEFIESIGVKKKSEEAKILRGKSAVHDLFNDIERTIGEDGELMVSHVEKSFAENYGPGRMNSLIGRCRKTRILLNGEFALLTGENRKLPEDWRKSNLMIFLYGRKTAMALWGDSVIVLLDSREVFDAGRKHFEYLWNNSKEMGGT